MFDPIEIEEYRGHKIKVYIDTEPDDPRSWDNLGILTCFHKKYSLGDEHTLETGDFESWEDLESYLIADSDLLFCLPVFMYDHSGITVSHSPFSCRWDSGQIGFHTVSKAKVRQECGVKRISAELRRKVRAQLEAELSTYDQYLRGEVYGYMIEGNLCDDSCWGFYDEAEMLTECRSIIDYSITEARKSHYNLMKGWITKRVPFHYRYACPVA